MPSLYRILIAAGILVLDWALFFLPIGSLFLDYVLMVNPPWFRDFLNGLDRVPREPGR